MDYTDDCYILEYKGDLIAKVTTNDIQNVKNLSGYLVSGHSSVRNKNRLHNVASRANVKAFFISDEGDVLYINTGNIKIEKNSTYSGEPDRVNDSADGKKGALS